MSAPLTPETRAVIAAILEALDIPHAATDGHDRTRETILAERLMTTVVTLQYLAEDGADTERLTWCLNDLRERLAEHPPVGYVTHEQALERLAAGADWSQAVALDHDQSGGPW